MEGKKEEEGGGKGEGLEVDVGACSSLENVCECECEMTGLGGGISQVSTPRHELLSFCHTGPIAGYSVFVSTF